MAVAFGDFSESYRDIHARQIRPASPRPAPAARCNLPVAAADFPGVGHPCDVAGYTGRATPSGSHADDGLVSKGKRAVPQTGQDRYAQPIREVVPAVASPSFLTSVLRGRGASTELTASAARSKPDPGGTARPVPSEHSDPCDRPAA